jgi:hypothetical protein
MSSQKWVISLVNQGKFKVRVVPAGCLLLKHFFIKWGGQAISAGANP